MYTRVITPSAKRSLKKLPHPVREDLMEATKILEQDPYAGEKLSGDLHFLHSFHFKSRNLAIGLPIRSITRIKVLRPRGKPRGKERASRVLTRAKARGIDPLLPSLVRK